MDKNINNYKYEEKLIEDGYNLIAGTDEVGRGPLIGPVVAAAVILPINYKLEGLTDSKKLSDKKRRELYNIIIKDAISYNISEVNNNIIDDINILEASKLAMIKSIEGLNVTPDYILIDAVDLGIENSKSIVKGDLNSITIAAASILAKVYRDDLMIKLHDKYPIYGFDKHKGYPTKAHIENIHKYGLIEGYRKTFKPISTIIDKEKNN